MKTKFLWVALLASAALIAQAQAGGRYGGGGGGGGGHFAAAAHSAPARGGAPSFRSMPMRSFGGGRFYSAQGFSSIGMRPASRATFHQPSLGSNNSALVRTPQLGNSNRSGRLARSSNQTNQAFANSRRGVSREDQFRRGSNNLPANWRNHVFAQHSANWHRDWDRGREHWWHGHRCRFVDGSWFIFDFGFYPWWSYGYPGYYGYDYYPYPYGDAPGGYYDPAVYEGDEYSDQNSYQSPDQNADSIVAAAQEQLSREGYYRGAIDAVLGPETRRAIARYQSNHGLRVTGYLTTETLQALGVGNLATN